MEASPQDDKERRARLAARASTAAALIALASAVIVAVIGYENNKATVQATAAAKAAKLTEQRAEQTAALAEQRAEQAATLAEQRAELLDKQEQRRQAFIQDIVPRLIDPNRNTRLAACIAGVTILGSTDPLFQTISALSGEQQCNSFVIKTTQEEHSQEEHGGWAIVFAHADTVAAAEHEVNRASDHRFAGAEIFKRRDATHGGFVAAITGFPSANQAELGALDVRGLLNRAAYIVRLEAYCPSYQIKTDSDVHVQFRDCTAQTNGQLQDGKVIV